MAPSPKPARAKLFDNGRSQAVRLPKEFRFEGDEVIIRKEGETVILEPIKRDSWPRGYWERLREVQAEFEVQPLRPELGEPDLE
jgi:antitoxin VapB